MARGEETYQGKLLESRDNDYKDEIVLGDINVRAIIVLAWGVWSVTIRAQMMQKIKIFFEHFGSNANMVYKFVDYCRSQRIWNKGYTSIP